MKTYEKVKTEVIYRGTGYEANWGNQLVNKYTIYLARGESEEQFDYFTGMGVKGTPNAKDLLYSLIGDYNYTVDDLVSGVGYSQNEARKIFNAIKCNNKKLDKLFSKREIEMLQNELEDY